MMRILFNTDSAAGNGAPAINEQNPPAPAPAAAPTPPAPEVKPVPAADTVNDAKITEETEQLRVKLAETEAAKKKVEMDHASVSDEFKRYKDATEARREEPVPVKKGKVRVGMFRSQGD